MAEVKGPLMSMSASGRFGDEMVFYERGDRQIVRRYVGKIKNSPGSSKNRNIFKEASELSKQLTPLDREAWNQMTDGLSLNGHNLFMKKAMDTIYAGIDFLPVTIHNYSFMANQAFDNFLRLDVAFSGEPNGEYIFFLGEGSYRDWAGGDVIDGMGDLKELLHYCTIDTSRTGSGGISIDGMLFNQDYWFRLIEINDRGLSAVFEIGLER